MIKFDLKGAGARTITSKASSGADFSWSDAMSQPEDPFFAISPMSTLSEAHQGEPEPAKERIDATLKKAVQPKK